MQPIVVDFFVLKKNQSEAELYLAKLVEKAWTLGSQLFIFTPSKEHAITLDNLLWTFKATSFLPHHIWDVNESPAPILISYCTPPIVKDVLINLSDRIPDFYEGFKRIIELVYEDPICKQHSRLKYRQYQKIACNLKTTNIT